MKRKALHILLFLLALTACVGQKDDPEDLDFQEDLQEEGGAESGTRFYRRILALEFTATWCQYCPEMQRSLSEARSLRAGRIVPLAVHQYDEMSPAEADLLVERFGVSSFPQMILDADLSTQFSEPSAGRIAAYVDAALSVEACGLAAESALEDGRLQLSVLVRPMDEAPCRVCAVLVEDGLTAFQAGVGEGYENNAVVRAYLDGGIDGLPLPALQDGEARVTFSAPAPDDPSKMRLVVYVLQEGKAVNALSLGLSDQKTYRYE